ncbi:MAG: efflux RND transporter permease subunit [Anaerolineae bacterium]|nr:efflux RND transporter permease subunit [Anaerolineae bacterium]
MLKSFFSAITRASLRYWWATIGLTVIFLVLGVLSAATMNQELLPPLEFPQTFIITFRPGASSDDMRDLITQPLEAEVAKIPGVILAGLESTTTGPVSAVTVRNEYGVNLAQVREQLKAVIKQVTDEGVPVGLKTTADLTPDIVTRVIKRAPSMLKTFNAQQLLAMEPAVLNAALAASPDVINLLDQLTRDQLAAARVDAAVNGEVASREPVDLPDAWKLTDSEQPRLLTFNLSALPVLTSSVSSSSADVKAEELRQFVEEKIVKPLSEGGEVKDVAQVSISGGQQIPPDIAESAKVAVEEQRKRAAEATATPAPTTTPEPASNNSSNTSPASDPPQQVAAPALPASWRSPLVLLPMRLQTQIVSNFETADDLLSAKDVDGKPKTAAEVLNAIAANDAYASLLRELSPDVLAYIRTKDATFAANLSDPALEQVTASILTSGAWSQLLNQAGFQKAGIATLTDLAKIKGTVAATLNEIVAGTPAETQSFAIRLVYSLTPEAVLLLSHKDADFAKTLSPQTLSYLSGPALAALPAGVIDGLSDAALKTQLQDIIADPSKAAGKAYESQSGSSDDIDPNAPPLPEGWAVGLKRFGLNATQADDLLKKPFGLSPGQFINQAGGSNPASLSELTADVLLYLAARDPNFYDELTPETLGGLTPEVLAKLPPEVASRAQRSFTPTTTITRANGQESLTLSVVKTDEGNTVNVSDGVEEFFAKLKQERPDLVVTEVFGQAEFIKESISGVGREGGLGAVMAVIVILLFLNFSVRSTLVTAVSIPTSVAIAFVMMKYVPGAVHGFIMQDAVYNALPEFIRTFMLRLFPAAITLNIMTLSGLTVAVGRVVDDAIVVLENIYRQLQSSTETDHREIIVHATRDVSAAIFAATLTTVVVFLPIGLTGGIVGEFFMPFGLAVTYSLGASFIVAITLVPLLAHFFIKRENIPEEKEGALERGYHSVLEWSLGHRAAVLGIAALTLVLGIALLAARPATFLPSFGEPQISASVTLPAGTKIAQTDVRVREFEDYLKTLTDKKLIDRFQIQIGSGGGLASFIGGGGGIAEGSASITIAPASKNTDELNSLTQEIRAKAEEVFGARSVKVSRASISEQGFGGFALVVSGPEESLRAVTPRIKEELAKVPGLTNITSTLDQVGGSAAYLRIGQTAAVSFSGELETQNTLGVTSAAIAKVKAMSDLPSDLVIGQGFQSQQQTEGFAQTFTSMGIAIVIVYFVMVLTFGSFVHPFTILFSLPLAIVGAALGLTVTNRVLGLSALIGMLMLIGIVVTNAIVMIDRVQSNRKERGMNLHDALVEGARTRLRPILMTAIATIFALLPLAIGLSEGAIIASELGTVVIGGLFSSTLLTLVVVPVIYSLVDIVQQRLTGRKSS